MNLLNIMNHLRMSKEVVGQNAHDFFFKYSFQNSNLYCHILLWNYRCIQMTKNKQHIGSLVCEIAARFWEIIVNFSILHANNDMV